MGFRRKSSLLIVSMVSGCLLTSCETVSVHRFPAPSQRVGQGPPAHAPAHGVRRNTKDGLELVYDATCGVYVIVGIPDHYYWDGHFYRLYSGIWEVSLQIDAGWAPTATFSLPPGLKLKGQGKAIGHQRRVVASGTNFKSRGKKVY